MKKIIWKTQFYNNDFTTEEQISVWENHIGVGNQTFFNVKDTNWRKWIKEHREESKKHLYSVRIAFEKWEKEMKHNH